ncbi:DoxX family protein [Cellulophaga sp. Hel_I_12]|uniref:DoxX family protein n=1 Tax=Cellulophaga sp. Hel_I_12 TaxID=1249972 RepID=UPI0006454C58|nr:DoxX family protein [Cellulophaga sp. Hel_I_12]
MSFYTFLIFFSAISFAFFGIGCFVAPRMKIEFLRYGLSKLRNFVGVLQLLGAIGLAIGYYFSPMLILVSASCLSLLMLLGFGVRLKIKDSLVLATPALFYALLNAYIAFEQWIIL